MVHSVAEISCASHLLVASLGWLRDRLMVSQGRAGVWGGTARGCCW